MSCVLNILRSPSDLAIPLTAAGRLAIHLALGGAFTVENAPAQPADAGGQLPIYQAAVLAYTVPFTCAGADTFSSGASGGGTTSGAVDGGASGCGSSIGRLL